LLTILLTLEVAHYFGLGKNMTFHCRQQLGFARSTRQVEGCIQSVQRKEVSVRLA